MTPSEIYEQYFGPAMFAPSARLLLELAQPQPGERVLDLACGTGRVTRLLPALVAPDGTVTGIDPSPPMLAIARALPPLAGPAIAWKEGNAVTLAEPDASYDLVTIQHGFQFFPDKLAAARHLRRVLVPGGRVVLSCWRGLEHHAVVRALFEAEAALLGTTATKLALPFSFGDVEPLRTVLADAGFTDIAIAEHVLDTHFPEPARYVQLSAMGAAAVMPGFENLEMDAFVAAVRAQVDPVVAQYTVGDELVMPMKQLIAVAR